MHLDPVPLFAFEYLHIQNTLITFAMYIKRNRKLDMDIVTRLNEFIESIGIGNSQFADTCTIPRPTLSQILNGRNKKISNELISKIHTAFPKLSVSWLMFGEGEMLLSENIKFSEAQNDAILDFSDIDHANNDPFTPFGGDNYISSQNDQSTQSQSASETATDSQPPTMTSFVKDNTTGMASIAEKINLKNKIEQPNNAATTKERKIINILVFYDDNSFEAFTPAGDKTIPIQ